MTNPHKPRMNGPLVECIRCPGYILAGVGSLPIEGRIAAFERVHASQFEPGKAPDITVDFEIVAECSICDDGGDIGTVDSETVSCRDCGATWAMDGTGGETSE